MPIALFYANQTQYSVSGDGIEVCHDGDDIFIADTSVVGVSSCVQYAYPVLRRFVVIEYLTDVGVQTLHLEDQIGKSDFLHEYAQRVARSAAANIATQLKQNGTASGKGFNIDADVIMIGGGAETLCCELSSIVKCLSMDGRFLIWINDSRLPAIQLPSDSPNMLVLEHLLTHVAKSNSEQVSDGQIFEIGTLVCVPNRVWTVPSGLRLAIVGVLSGLSCTLAFAAIGAAVPHGLTQLCLLLIVLVGAVASYPVLRKYRLARQPAVQIRVALNGVRWIEGHTEEVLRWTDITDATHQVDNTPSADEPSLMSIQFAAQLTTPLGEKRPVDVIWASGQQTVVATSYFLQSVGSVQKRSVLS